MLTRRLLDVLPIRIRRKLKNGLTLRLHGWLVLRPELKSVSPLGITIELTDQCNLSCSYCPKSLGIGSRGGHMDLDFFKEVVDQATAWPSIRQMPLVGFGEPLLYPHLEAAIAYVKAKNPRLRVTLTSNGTLLSSAWGHRLAEAGLDQITVSVNAGSREQYLRLNRADCYERVVENTRQFLFAVNASGAPMRVLLQVLEVPDGSADIKDFRRQWQPFLGRCGEIQVQPFVNWAGAIGPSSNPSGAKTSKATRPRPPCPHLLNGWIVTREGDALACCMVFPGQQGELALGNVRDKPLHSLYFGAKSAQLRRINLDGRLGELSPCDHCDAYRTVPNVWLPNPFHRWFGPRWW